MSGPDERALQRWRLVLGRYGEQRRPETDGGGAGELTERQQRMDAVLEQLYGREYGGRGVRDRDPDREGGLGASRPQLVDWLGDVRELFPRETAEVIQQHALERYGLTELLTDPATLERLEPNQELLGLLLSVRGQLDGAVLQLARRVIAQVVAELERRLEPEVRRALAGRVNRFRHAVGGSHNSLDADGTVRANLRHYDPDLGRLVIERAMFFERSRRTLPWEVILCVDASGSMADSVIHSAVTAGILARMPAVAVRMVVFDTSVVDLSGHVDDPVEILSRIQLGGGTDIGQAVRYCEQLVGNPRRTVLALITDFYEGAPVGDLLAAVTRLAEARVRLLGLAALDSRAEPAYDRELAGQLAARGMQIGAMTPRQLAGWLAEVMS